MTMTTVADSRMSIASYSSETSQADEAKGGLTPTEARAKKLKYINIEFCEAEGKNYLS
jgi:hypothetical protein